MSGMPFSGVVVGVGDSDFEDMEVLDADEEVLADDKGNQAVRDIIQLVKYDDFKELGMRELALQVLGEVPDQFVDYMVMMQVQKHLLYSHSKDTPTPTPKDDPELSLKQVDLMEQSAKETPAGNNFKTNP
jgi:hypothetical protein